MKENKTIYLDNAATTVPNEDVVALYNEIELKHFGNANSIHALGVDSAKYLNAAKDKILKSFSLTDARVILTSSASEANNLAIKGTAFKYQSRGKHLITSKIEHPSTLEAFKQLEEDFGFKVTYLNVDKDGLVDLKDLEASIDDETILVSIMAVNNEIGTIEPIEGIVKIVHKHPKALLHVDMTQAIGKVDFNYKDIDMFSFSAHKIHGLKGSGALIAKNKISFTPIISGGDQEYSMRAGTSNVASACALAKALELSLKSKKANLEHVKKLHEHLVNSLKDEDIVFNSENNTSPYIVNFSLLNKKASVVVEALSLKGIYVSSVSACHSKREPISYVVEETSHDNKRAKNTIRVSFNETNTIEDVDAFVNEFKKIVRSIQ